jgi:hypothetical protein
MSSEPSLRSVDRVAAPARRTGAPTELMLLLARSFGLRDFVETGTFEGRTAAWAAERFERVATIENARSIFERTSARLSHLTNARFVFGHSKDVLGDVVARLDGPALFWLDGHWSGGETYGEGDECPVLDELRLIDASPHEHFVLIDDARLFVAPPPRPHRAEHWPSIAELCAALLAKHADAYVVVIDDAVVRVPARARSVLSDYCQDLATQALAAEAARRSTTAEDGARMVVEGLRVVGRELRGRLGRGR